MPDPEVVVSETPEVNPETMDDAAIDKLLAEPETTDTPPVTTEPAKTTEVKQEDVKPAEEAKETQEKEPEKPATPDPATLAAENEKLKKQLKDKEAFIQRQANEVGELRKKAATLRQEARDSVDPSEAAEKVMDARAAESEAASVERQIRTNSTEAFIEGQIPEFKSLVDDMAALVTEDARRMGTAEETIAAVIRNFKTDPYSTPPEVLYNIAARASERKKAMALESQIKELSAKIANLSKKPDEALKRADEAARKSPVMTAASSGTVHADRTSSLDDVTIPTLSDAELDALLKENKQGG